MHRMAGRMHMMMGMMAPRRHGRAAHGPWPARWHGPPGPMGPARWATRRRRRRRNADVATELSSKGRPLPSAPFFLALAPRQSRTNTRPMNAPARLDALPRFATALKAIESLKPGEPLYLVHPEKFAAAAKQFLDGFPGDVLYAVKANPHPIALTNLWDAGIRHFDTASLGEIEIVKDLFPDAICHFMAPVRLPGQAKAAFEKHGVTDFVVDSDAELDKLLAETGNPKKLRVFVRLVAQLGGALLEMSSKYGCRPEEAAKLLKRVQAGGRRALPDLPCRLAMPVAFLLCPGDRDRPAHHHPVGRGDRGAGYRRRLSRRLCRARKPPPYHWYFDMIKEALQHSGPARPAGDVRAGPRPGGARAFRW